MSEALPTAPAEPVPAAAPTARGGSAGRGAEPPGAPGRSGRRVARRAATVAAGLLVLVALVAPDDLRDLSPLALARVPVEGLLAAAVLLIIPPRATRASATVAGALLGLLVVVRCLDTGFLVAFDRPFDPLADWYFLGPAVEFVARSVGRPGAVAAAIVAVALAAAVPVGLAWAAARLARVGSAHRARLARTVAVLGVVWVAAAVVDARVGPDLPVAATEAAGVVSNQAGRVRAGLADRDAFAAQSRVDAYRYAAGSDLLTALRGKDVVLAFVESYGRVALDDPVVTAALDAGAARLRAAGLVARSAYVGSPTAGGASWLAHATLQSGLWVDSQRRYTDLVRTDRLTLSGAFRRAGWRTVAVAPANHGDWPEAGFYGFDRVYNAGDLGYEGPRFTFDSVPDQFTLSAFHRAERVAIGRPPVMAELDLISSHAPWSPVPPMLDWSTLGDGAAYASVSGSRDIPESVLSRDTGRVRADYARSIAYSVHSLTDYAARYSGENLVMVFLGDHQPAPVVAGDGAPREAPITIVARDPAVLDRITGWNWTDGLRPGPSAPVWRMDTVRDRFLAAFGGS
ncbi:sulfatase [Luedemannella helvata]|uniref:Sulfatase n=1 Tax=Luedemannella helvata TaxID=349315 RepID=A0ABN2JS25_9ACTN